MKKLAFCILTACFATGLFAQDIAGTIEGSVLDPSGSAVPKAKVTITNTDRKQVVRTLTTNESGVYSAPFLPIGNYSVKAEAAGFKIERAHGDRPQRRRRFENQLHAWKSAQTTETVEVKATAACGRPQHARQRHYHRWHAGPRTGAGHAQFRATGQPDAGRVEPDRRG